MKKVLIPIFMVAMFSIYTGCATSGGDSSANSEFADFDDAGGGGASSPAGGEDAALEKELTEAAPGSEPAPQETAQQAPPEAPPEAAPGPGAKDEFAEFDQAPSDAQNQVAQSVPPPEIAPEPIPPTEAFTEPPLIEEPVPMPTPEPQRVATPKQKLINISRMQFKSNDGGGTLTLEGDAPMTYNTRVNAQLNQFIIEIPQSKLSTKAKRPLNTKDFPGGFGSVDPYQNAGSTTARIVIQLRDGASEPVVQSEGNQLLVMTQAMPANPVAKAGAAAASTVANAEGSVDDGDNGTIISGPGSAPTMALTQGGPQSRILTSASLQEFLSGNQQFYGKLISIEANDADLREVFKFISEESGVNLIVAEEVKGKVSVKLKQVPWDQALVVLMKSKKLGYSRQGQILRIARLADLKQEEEDYASVAKSKSSLLPLTIKMIPVSYSKVDDLVKQVAPFLSDRGKVIAETRTSAIVVSDVSEAIARVEKLVQSLDVPPAQVLIEGKIVEATETFQRFIGVNWSTSGDSIDVGRNSRNAQINANGGSHAVDTIGNSINTGMFNFSLGTLDFLGNLQATLGLNEKAGTVKVLSSPRILTLHNEKASISQESEIPLLSTVIVPGSTTVQKNVVFKPVRLKLDVVPQVTNDASVILAVEVTREFAGATVDQDTQAKPINKREAKTKVIVRNGQTAVIGGIYQTDMSDQENYVPGLGKIPVIGWLFKGKQNDRTKNELLIFLTPRILGMADTGLSVPPPTPTEMSAAPSEGDLAL